MANWAIVIGIDKYWLPSACLRGAVNDALRMRDWLLGDGGVPRQNLTLLLGPDRVQPPAGLNWKDAARSSVVRAIDKMLVRSGGEGERFFFHFSGHGLTARGNFVNQGAIALADFDDTLTDNSLTVLSLFHLFEATRFKEQFFFVDACRNLPFSTELRLGEYPKSPTPEQPPYPQFIMFATQPGMKAIEIKQPGNERGAFTEALLEGLGGKGAAKRWDEEAGGYVVRWNSLFEFVEAKVKSQKLAAKATPDGPVIQEPKQFGERGTENPRFGQFSPAAFGDETLEVGLLPKSISNIAEIRVSEAGELVKRKAPPLSNLPVAFQLVPRSYSVRAAAPGYVSKPRYIPVELYDRAQVELELVPSAPSLGPAGGPPPPPSGGPPPEPFGGPTPSSPEAERGFGVPAAPAALFESAARRSAGPRKPALLTLQSVDQLGFLELTDSSGKVIANGRARPNDQLFRERSLSPGFYRARLVSPEGEPVEKLFELLPGASEVVTLGAAPPVSKLLDSIISRGGFEIGPDHTISVSETVGPASSLKLSTVLALAAAAASEVDSPHGRKLKALGLPSFEELAGPACASGVQVVVGDESATPQRWEEAEVRCWRLKESPPRKCGRLVVARDLKAVASSAVCRERGGHWLGLRLPRGGDLTIPLAVLPNRVALVVLTFDAQGTADLHQYSLELPRPPGAAPADLRLLDPEFKRSRFAAMRRIELMQRSAAIGRITPTLPDVDLLLWDKWIDPVAGCLGGYLLVRLGRAVELQVPARNLTTYFGDLPDAHVLNGVYLEKSDSAEGDPKSAYLAALDRGLPMFRDGLALLESAIERLELRHEGASRVRTVLAAVPAGSLWSSIPECLASLEQDELLSSVAEIAQEPVAEAAAISASGGVSIGAPSIDSKFRFVLLAARRAEQLMRGAKPKSDVGPKFVPARVAMDEIAAGLVDWDYGPAPAIEAFAAPAETGSRRARIEEQSRFEEQSFDTIAPA
jgi:DNA-directed RNA polymerase omega subunit